MSFSLIPWNLKSHILQQRFRTRFELIYIITQTIFSRAEGLVRGRINQSYELNKAQFRFKCLGGKLGKYSYFLK